MKFWNMVNENIEFVVITLIIICVTIFFIAELYITNNEDIIELDGERNCIMIENPRSPGKMARFCIVEE